MASRFVLPALSLLSAFNTVNAALPTISTAGNKFFDSDGNQFFIKGVAYQLLPSDPLYMTQQCQMDATLMATLGTNAIRIYHVDPYVNHDGCMAAFDAAGIYTFIDLDTFNTTVVETAPAWTQEQFQAYAMVMDVFSKYDNVAGFYIGNEIINTVGDATMAAPYIKASLADLKAYQTKQNYRRIPIGYSHADVAGLRPVLQDYFICGTDQSQNLDFFSLNLYEWCGNNDYMTSGYSLLQNQTEGFPVPIFVSETGCNVPEPRTFEDQAAIFGPMSGTWSGSIIYEWIQEDNHYGLITYGGGNADALDSAAPPGGYSRSGTPTPISPDFSNLMSAWKTVSPSGVMSAAYKATGLTTPSCPAYTAGAWEVSGNVPLPTIGAAAVSVNSFSAAPATSVSQPASITSAASTAQSSAESVRSSLQSTAASAALTSQTTVAAAGSASGAANGAEASSSKGAGVANSVGINSGLSGLILAALMWF